MNIYYKKVMKLDIGRFWANIAKLLPAVLVPMAIQVLFMKLVPIAGRKGFLLYGVMYVGLYGICMLLFGLNKYEKQLIFKRLK